MKKTIEIFFVIIALFSCNLISSNYRVKIHNPNDFDLLYVINDFPNKYCTGEHGFQDDLDYDPKKLKSHDSKEYTNIISSFDERIVEIDYAMKDPSDDTKYTGKIYNKRIKVEPNFYKIAELTFD